ncbi:ChaN family lipoprotein [Pseudomonas borbori]
MRIASLLVLLVLAGCQTALPPLPEWQSPEGLEHPDLGLIVDLRSGRHLTAQQLLESLAVAPRVLIGERHDNPDHHALQLWLLEALAVQREQGSLLLEMLTPDQQIKVDEVRRQIAAGQQIDDLPQALAWQTGWDWALYGPIVSHALHQPYPLLAANLERAEVVQIYKHPSAASSSVATAYVRDTLLEQIRLAHCDLLPENQLPAMLAVQLQRDRRMAEAVLAAPEPSLLLAGAYHVRRDLGVPLHLHDPDARATNRVLIFAEVGQPVSASQADYVWYTAAVAAQDHCAKLRP